MELLSGRNSWQFGHILPWRRSEGELIRNLFGAGLLIYNYANPQCGIEEPLTYRRNCGLLLWKAGYDGVMNYAYQAAFGGHMWNDFDRGGDFIGRQALIEQKEKGVPQKLVLMTVEAGDAEALGYNGLYKDGEYVGMTSSGGYGHRVGQSLAMGYIRPDLAEPGTKLEVEILDERFPATVVPRPYYDPANERMKT